MLFLGVISIIIFLFQKENEKKSSRLGLSKSSSSDSNYKQGFRFTKSVRLNKSSSDALTRSKSVMQLKNVSLRTNQNKIEKSGSSGELKRSKSFDRKYVEFGERMDSDETLEDENNIELNSKLLKVKAYYENLCKAKDKELETIRQAHQRRLERLVSLEKQYKLIKEQLKSYVDEEGIKEEIKMTKMVTI